MMLELEESLESQAKALTFRRLTPAQWRQSRVRMRHRPQWFVLRRESARQDRWRAVAGPFCAPEDALARLAQLRPLDAQRSARSAARWQVASLSETMRIYCGNVPLLAEDLSESDMPDAALTPG